jgi:hypothetical protein
MITTPGELGVALTGEAGALTAAGSELISRRYWSDAR